MSSSAQKKKLEAIRGGGKKEKKSDEDMTEAERKHKAKIDKIKEQNKARKEKYKEMTSDSPKVHPGKGKSPYDEEEGVKFSDNDWRDVSKNGTKEKGCGCVVS